MVFLLHVFSFYIAFFRDRI